MTKTRTAGCSGRASFARIKVAAFGVLMVYGSWGGQGAFAAVPPPAQVLAYRPHQSGVDYTTPPADKVEACKVDWVRGQPKNGWTLTLKDPEGNLLRRFVDTNGDNRPDVWSYYKDGVEVYSEIDTTFDRQPPVPNQYRWFNAGGSKWGIDANKDGRI